MGTGLKRRLTALAWLLGVAIGFSMHMQVVQAQPHGLEAAVTVDIPQQPLDSALIQLSRQSGIEVLMSSETVKGLQTEGAHGTMSLADALTRLLKGTSLSYRAVGARTISIQPDAGGVPSPDARNALPDAGSAAGADTTVNVTLPAGAPAATASIDVARRDGIEEIIVTGQKREERIQDVPIAISAFSMENLDNQKIEGGFDLLKAVPNVTFSKSNFSGYNFQIRGIGTQAISATTDPGVAVSFNNTTLIVNRLFEQEYLDIERVEVLRGPQGTLFGRNATAGVINVISAKPEMGVAHGEFKLETGNYSAQRFRGYFNTPFLNSDTLAVRGAFAMTKRDGYGTNLAASDPDIQDFIRTHNRAEVSNNIDNRDLWTGRLSLGWHPTDAFRANLIYERFQEDDRRMRSTKQLCHFDNGEITLYDPAGNAVALRDAIDAGQTEREIQTRFAAQLTQGCLPKSLFDKGDPLSGNHGAYGTPNGNGMPFLRAGRGGTFVINNANNPFPHDPTCVTGEAIISSCVLDPMATPGGQSRDLRAIFSMIDPQYQAMSELIEGSFDIDLSDGLTLSSQTVYMTNELFSTQDFLRFKTLPVFNNSKNAGFSGPNNFSHRRGFFLGGVFNDPQLGPSDRLLMQDVSQQDARQFSQELRLVSNFEGPLNFSFGANYTRFETVTDYFVFINMLPALVYGGEVYSGVPGLPPGSGSNAHLGIGLWGSSGVANDMAIGCGTRMAQVEQDILGNDVIATCVYVQDGSIDDVRSNPEGHNFFLSRNPYQLNAASVFSELYYEFSPALKLTAGLRFNWDRKTFTPVPSQTLLADWRGRFEGGNLGDVPTAPLSPDANPGLLCDPRLRHLGGGGLSVMNNVICATGGLAENGRGYPSLPDMVQEWRVPTGRIGLDWKVDTGFTDETLLYAFYTRGYKAGGANPPTQSAPSGLLLAAAQGAAAPPLFKAEYVNALELGTKNRLFGGAVTLNGTAFYYDYTDYQISKILDRSANNENIDASVWGLELEAVFAPAVDTLLNASVGYLRTRIADGEQSLDLMDRTQGGNHRYVDPTWAGVDCSSTANANHLACLYPNGFDQWVLVRPTITQASSCIAPAVLVYDEIRSVAASTLGNDVMAKFCPGGELLLPTVMPQGYDPFTSAPNSGAGFLADVSGNELPNAPRFTVSLGAQHTSWLPGGNWSVTGRVDWYWQDESYHRIYNTEYDQLQAWTNTNLSVWVANDRLGVTIEAYVKNVFDDAPITGAFMNSDDTGLSTNVFTLDPRLIGLSIRKRF